MSNKQKSEPLETIIKQRCEMRLAEAHLRNILEMYIANDSGYDEMKYRIEKLTEWVWESSSIA